MGAAYEVYWELLTQHDDEGLRLTALRAFFFSAVWPGVYRVGHRKWLAMS